MSSSSVAASSSVSILPSDSDKQTSWMDRYLRIPLAFSNFSRSFEFLDLQNDLITNLYFV